MDTVTPTPNHRRWYFSRPVSALALLLATLSLGGPLLAKADDGHEQRVLFLETKKALERSDYTVFGHNIQQLQEYPLYPYLIYWQLRANLKEQPAATIEAFLNNYVDLPISSQLRGAWLQHLAREQHWAEYLKFYRGGSTAMQCHLHTAQLHTGNKAAAWEGAKALWLVGSSQPDACDALFQAWGKAGGLSRDLRWQRIELAMEKGNSSLAQHLAKALEQQDRDRVTLWRRVLNDPTLVESNKQLRQDSIENRVIIIDGLKRLARKDPERAATLWGKVNNRYHFATAQRDTVIGTIARSFAQDGDDRGLIWYAQLSEAAVDQDDRSWAVHLAMRHGNWKAALAWLETMPVTERQDVEWQYWRARTVEALGDKQQAEHLYFTASGDRGYYGFLAADRINSAYNLEHQPVEASAAELQALKESPEMVRAHELYMLLLTTDARREWESAVAAMDNKQRLIAGKLADEWKWYDTALITLAKANYFSDLDIRFPLAHNEAVTREAQSRELDPSWVYAVARQESAMFPEARSPAGALGLMQLMPSTGKAVAKKLNYPMKSTNQLLEPDTNIHLGTYYLRQVLDRFNNNPVLATAAYNAGPHRVSRWKPEQGSVDADIWVENMPFHETRQYVRRVMAYSVFYDQRLDKGITRLRERMPAIVTNEENLPL